jgi:hypothetical protein
MATFPALRRPARIYDIAQDIEPTFDVELLRSDTKYVFLEPLLQH